MGTAETWGIVKYRNKKDYKGAWIYIQLRRGSDLRSTNKQKQDYKDRKKMTVEDLRSYAVDQCPICFSPLNYGRGDNKFKFTGRTPSLDNKDPAKGYNVNNTKIICCDCNTWKGQHTLKHLMNEFEKYPNNHRLKKLIDYMKEDVVEKLSQKEKEMFTFERLFEM